MPFAEVAERYLVEESKLSCVATFQCQRNSVILGRMFAKTIHGFEKQNRWRHEEENASLSNFENGDLKRPIYLLPHVSEIMGIFCSLSASFIVVHYSCLLKKGVGNETTSAFGCDFWSE